MSFIAPILPDNSPFSPLQRAWLDGYLAALFADETTPRPNTIAPQGDPQSQPQPQQFGQRPRIFPGTIRHCRSTTALRSPPRSRSSTG